MPKLNEMVKNDTLRILALSGLFMLTACSSQQPPLSLHPDNPHYFLFRGKPTVLIGSTEHYGAVLNTDFDYVRYLDELESKGLNLTRTFTGIYLEPKGAFGIANNTLAPEAGKLICPWRRSSEPGCNGGGNKFDLTKWDDVYFDRLKDFIVNAGKRNIIVELDLFSNFYDTLQWKLSPLYSGNNINGLPKIEDQKEILSLKHPEILDIQEKMVFRILSELNNFDNLYYEVCNEPYFGDLEALNSWQKHMSKFVADAEKKMTNQHLISNNISNGFQKIDQLTEGISIANFHYAKPPVTVEMNYHLNKALGDNETGFNGIEDVQYRTEAWDFITAGGALFNNLDYSFTAENEDGSFLVKPGQPGGGGSALRSQLNVLKNIVDELDFIHMKPMNSCIKNALSGTYTARALANPGKQYLFYINGTNASGSFYSLRYTGSICPNLTGKYWIYTLSDDGVRLFIDHKMQIQNWTEHGAVTDSVLLDLKAGVRLPFVLEYYQGAGGAELKLSWKTPSGKVELIPISALTAPDGKTPGLSVEHFSDIELKQKTDEFISSTVDPAGVLNKSNPKNKPLEIVIDLPAGTYSGEWIDPVSGARTGFDIEKHKGGNLPLITSSFSDDLALKIQSKK
jgi:hypothetical protein